MCDPVTGLMVASTLMTASGQIYQGNATAAAARYNAQIAEMNATISDRRARDAIERGQKAEQEKRREVAQVMGAQTAAMSANGVDISFGSPLDTLVGTATLGELDALTIRNNSFREEYDFRVQAANQRAQANMNRLEASTARTAGYLGAASTVLGGASRAVQYGKTGKIS